MDRRTTAVLVIALLTIATIGTAALLRGPPRADLSREPLEADQVTLYPSGLAFVQLQRSFEATEPRHELAVEVPPNALLSTFQVKGDGVSLRALTAVPPNDAGPRPGDDVIAHVQDGPSLEGVVTAIESGDLHLDTEEGRAIIPLHRIAALELPGQERGEPSARSTLVKAIVETEEGTQDVRIAYLVQGPRWTPSHELDVATGAFTFHATLTNMQEWDNVTLQLVAGQPQVRTSQADLYAEEAAREASDSMADAGAGAASPSPGFSSGQSLGELRRYTFDEPMTFRAHETVRLPVVTGTVDVDRRAHRVQAWAGGNGDLQVQEVYTLGNALGEIVPAGEVHVYDNGDWTSTTTLEAWPEGEQQNITTAVSQSLTARQTTESRSEADRDVYTTRITLENHGDDTADVHLRLNLDTYRTNVLETTPDHDRREGDTIIWDHELASDGSQTFTLQWERLRNDR